MPPQKIAYSVCKQDGSREAGGHDCMSGEAMNPTSFPWELWSKIAYVLHVTHPRDCSSALGRDWKEAAGLAVHLYKKRSQPEYVRGLGGCFAFALQTMVLSGVQIACPVLSKR